MYHPCFANWCQPTLYQTRSQPHLQNKGDMTPPHVLEYNGYPQGGGYQRKE